MTVNTDSATDSETAGEPTEGETATAATDSATAEPSVDSDDSTGSEADETDAATEESEEPKADREAARYRRQLRDTEAERDRLATQVESYHRAEVERLASSRLIDARDFWAGGATLDSLLNDAGQVDPVRVAQAVRDLAASRPHWCKNAAAPAGSVTPGARKPDTSGDDDASTTTWGDVFTRARTGTVEAG
ncbi:hypothetical protein [Mycolicibacterium psychrotolerans]|uniref:Scaffolding protein n=1 Tax=Mycolicibacterium psychrotolerans TaxID=216929 RepID=A0A7I7MA02_9MYCO|nr:hypothetical protein [Mycolicibacterium psychrotolerans]BBX69014.1 hypothetical protein MPSYJ_24750 [Mycolicibacterium psychrotolerans]